MTDEVEKTPEELIESIEEAQQPVTREDVKAEFRGGTSKGGGTVAIVAILAGAVVLLGCIISCAVVLYAFTLNAPW